VLMSIREPACLRRVFDHHIVQQPKPPCESVRDLSKRTGRLAAGTKRLKGEEFQLGERCPPNLMSVLGTRRTFIWSVLHYILTYSGPSKMRVRAMNNEPLDCAISRHAPGSANLAM
jgi:hypothetical protein